MFGWTKKRRRRQLLEQPVSLSELDLLRDSLWQSDLLSSEDRIQLVRWMRVFVHEKHWEGCNGLKLSEEMKRAVAASAGLMVLRHPDWYFDFTQTILIYPRAYVARIDPKFQNASLGGEFPRAGETIYRGPVVLNWQDIRRASRGPQHGHHIVVHELAHQLDMINGPHVDGLPPLPAEIDEGIWKGQMQAEYVAAREMVEDGYDILMDDYGLTEESEFFAVASELYFQLPDELAEFHPNVFELLKLFYQIDLRRRSTFPSA